MTPALDAAPVRRGGTAGQPPLGKGRMLRGQDVAFVVRIWLEEREIAGARPLWRGVVEHAQSGERFYFTDLRDIAGFIDPYVRAMGGEIAPPEQTRHHAPLLRRLLSIGRGPQR